MRPLVIGVSVVLIAAIATRAWLHFSKPLVPGLNGAYYLIQTRAVLEDGKLALSDFPLIFWLQAGIAHAIHVLTGISRDESVILGVKISDSVFPALSVISLGIIGWRWSCSERSPSFLAAIVPAALAAGFLPVLATTGSFQKNSLGLALLAAFACAAHGFLRVPTWPRATSALLFLALVALTHVGVAAAALLLAVALLFSAWLMLPDLHRKIRAPALLGVLVLAVALAISAQSDPQRVRHLIRTSYSPAWLTAQPTVNPAVTARPVSTKDWLRFRREPLVLLGIGIATAAAVFRLRQRLPPADRAFLLSCSVLTIFLTTPIYNADVQSRFLLIASVPAAICLSALLAVVHLIARVAAVALAMVYLMLVSTPYVRAGGWASISPESFAELRELRSLVRSPAETIVVTRHGFEWWASWVLRSKIAQSQAVSADMWTRYSDVLFLVENPPAAPYFVRLPSGKVALPARRGNSAGSLSAQPTLPPDAVVLHEGPRLRLVRVASPPAYIR